ncbi:hypothetical protein SNE40_011803 [Patella caerulea]|uniref:Uncharacterized protein n=1 Tax=Patella caerulea TaxID=87958 RepID=A0AAN8PPS9_PATCE
MAVVKTYSELEELRKIVKENSYLVNDELQNPTLLGQAAKTCNVECVEFLLNSGANVNIVDREGKTPMYYCLTADEDVRSEDKVGCLKLLLKAGSQLYGTLDSVGSTPLMLAASRSEVECVSEILKAGYLHGPKQNLLTQSNKTVTVVGMSSHDKESGDGDDDHDDKDQDDVSESTIDSEEYDDDYLKYKARYNHTSIDFRNRSGFTALRCCLFDKPSKPPASKTVACLRLLVDAGCDIGVTETSADFLIDYNLAEVAINVGLDASIVKCLVELGCQVDYCENMSMATKELDLGFVRYMMAAGADVSCDYPTKNNALHTLLLSNGWCLRHITCTDSCQLANYEKIKTMMKFFVREKVNMDALGDDGVSCVVLACFYKLIDFSFPLEFLLSENVSLPDNIHRWMKSYHEMRTSRYFDEGTGKFELLKLLYGCGLSPKGCHQFRENEEVNSRIVNWLAENVNQPQPLKTLCKHKLRRILGNDIKTKVPLLRLPLILQDLLLLKDVLTSECFE